MPITFPCSNCGKTFSVPENLVGKQARCSCGMSVTIPAQSITPAPAQPQMPVQQMPVQPMDGYDALSAYQTPQMAGGYQPQAARPKGRAFDAMTMYELGAGVVGTIYAWPVIALFIDAIKTLKYFNARMMGTIEFWIGLIAILAMVMVVVSAVLILCRLEIALPMGAISAYVLLGMVVITILYTLLRSMVQIKVEAAFEGLGTWITISPYLMCYATAPATMIFAFHINLTASNQGY